MNCGASCTGASGAAVYCALLALVLLGQQQIVALLALVLLGQQRIVVLLALALLGQ